LSPGLLISGPWRRTPEIGNIVKGLLGKPMVTSNDMVVWP
jgi:hypothetical protein